MRCPVPPQIPERRGEEPFPLKHTTPRFFYFFYSLSFLSHFFFFFWVWVVLGSVGGDPSTALYWGVGYPMANVIKPPFLPFCLTIYVFFLSGAGLRLLKVGKARSAWTPACWIEESEVYGGVFSRNPCSYVVLAQWGVQGSVRKVGRWLPHAGDVPPHGPHPPFLITSPKGVSLILLTNEEMFLQPTSLISFFVRGLHNFLLAGLQMAGEILSCAACE